MSNFPPRSWAVVGRWARLSLLGAVALTVLSRSALASVPEIDPGSAGSALAVLFGGVLILTDRFARKRARKGD